MVTLNKGMATRVSIPQPKMAAPPQTPAPAAAPVIKASGNLRIQEMLKKSRSSAPSSAPQGSALARLGVATKPGAPAAVAPSAPPNPPAPQQEQYLHLGADEVKAFATMLASEIGKLSGSLTPVWKIQQTATLNGRAAFSPETASIVRGAEISLAAASLSFHRLSAALEGGHGSVLVGSELDLIESLGQYAVRLQQTLA